MLGISSGPSLSAIFRSTYENSLQTPSFAFSPGMMLDCQNNCGKTFFAVSRQTDGNVMPVMSQMAMTRLILLTLLASFAIGFADEMN